MPLQAARSLVDTGADRTFGPLQRSFIYLPFEHAEDLVMQDESVRLYTELATEHAVRDDLLDYARRHRDVIRRFGRYPHRNAALLRVSTPAETAFLEQPGSRF